MAYDRRYLAVGSAADLRGRDWIIYRLLETLPGLISWGTILLVIVLSWKKPVWVAVFIITFDLYWLVKTVFLSFHLRANWRRMQHHLDIDWQDRLRTLKWDHIWQLVLLPVANESREVVEDTLNALKHTSWPRERLMVVLSFEDTGDNIKKLGEELKATYGSHFDNFFVTYHPQQIPGEMRGKGSNVTWACKHAKSLIDKKGIPHEDILVSAFDIDTKLYPQYFLCLAWNFLTCEKPYRSSFQPVPVYHNNVWEAGSLSRVVSASGTFWQMMQQERPERLTTFSSHSMSFKSLEEVGFWQTNIVSEDSRIFWNHFLYFDGDWQVVPLSYPVSMDANLAHSTFSTFKNIYRQQRRWGWGVENIPYVLFGFIKNAHIPRLKKIRFTVSMIEGFWSWSTNALLIFALGWLPLVLGGREFAQRIIAFNLPRITRTIMTVAMFGIVTSAVVSLGMLRKMKLDYKERIRPSLILSWILMPFTIVFFGSIPALEAQTRLMLGGRFRLGFWVTPKDRKVIQNDTKRL